MQQILTLPCLASQYCHALRLFRVKLHGFRFKHGCIATAIVVMSRGQKIPKTD